MGPEKHTACPNREELTAFNAGRLAGSALASVADHVATCSRCLAVLDEMGTKGPGTTIRRSRMGAEDFLAEKEFRVMEARARALGSSPQASAEMAELAWLERYSVVSRVHQSDTGILYQARERGAGRVVAVKVVPAPAEMHAAGVVRFRQSVGRAAGAHPHVLPVLEVLRGNHVIILMTPFVEGRDLGRILRERKAMEGGGRPADAHPWAYLEEQDYWGEIRAVLDQVVEVVAAVHAAGEVVGGIQASNCLVDRAGKVWISDCGVAHFLVPGPGMRWVFSPEQTAQGFGGTEGWNLRSVDPALIAPEEWAGGRVDGRRRDVFRLGVLIERAVRGMGWSAAREPGPVVGRCLSRLPGERYRSAVELRADWLKLARE